MKAGSGFVLTEFATAKAAPPAARTPHVISVTCEDVAIHRDSLVGDYQPAPGPVRVAIGHWY